MLNHVLSQEYCKHRYGVYLIFMERIFVPSGLLVTFQALSFCYLINLTIETKSDLRAFHDINFNKLLNV